MISPIADKIRIITEKLRDFAILNSTEIQVEFIECPEYKTTNQPPAFGADWKTIHKETYFGGIDHHYWLYFTLPAMKSKTNTERRISVKTGFERQMDATNPQFTVFVNGKTTQALDTNHTWFPLEYDKEYEIYMYLYTAMHNNMFHVSVSEQIIDIKTEDLYYDINVPYLCMLELTEDSYDRHCIQNALDSASLLLDFRDVYSQEYYESIDKTSEYLKTEFYEKVCGKADFLVSCVGHTHIDVAWLWTVAQTKEKVQRSFSTVVNLLKRYKDYIFMSSQPQLYQFVKENDPELYDEIKEYIKKGRWEAEGAMWLEADTNLISGESLVRQILYGKKFMKKEFGIDNKILWLPDVFGYSAALPQILKKSGITHFFTTKLNWNDTNEIPHYTFMWKGIDGSEVFSSFSNTYVPTLTPKDVKISWEKYKDKKFVSNSLLTFGYGDGGGGPTYEMLENYKRLKYGIPGMPSVKIEKASEYFERVEGEFKESTQRLRECPKWVGELYLERHRGTYTSIAKNKKYNRKSEFLYQKAESLAVTDMILNNKPYPVEMLEKNQYIILLNQFHDIIPGSSIREVYEVSDAEYEAVIANGNNLARMSIGSIMNSIKTDGGIFVYNPSPFPLSDTIEVNGKKVYAENIPAHGWRVIKYEITDTGIIVDKCFIENEYIKVTFNEKYHIISVYDKTENREVIPENSEANCLEIFEDYPLFYDAWELSDYYMQKKWIADDVSDVLFLENGLRIKRKYMKSEIVQDIVLNKASKRIDFITKVDWHEDHVIMKAAFPVDILNSVATYDIQFGNIERPTHKNTSWDATKFEVSAHKWADLSEGGYGVSLLNDCKYGYNIEENIMKISLLKAATFPHPEADRGVHEFTYSLYPHDGDFRQGKTVQEGYKLNIPLEVYEIEAHDGNLPDNYSFAKSNCENVVIETIKKAEEEEAVIVRLFESYNQKSVASITVGFDFKEVYLCDLMENNIKKLDNTENSVSFNIKNFEIVTLKFIY